MSAIARYYLSINTQVFGYDKTATRLTDALQEEGAQIFFEDNVEALPFALPAETKVIYTPALPSSSKLLTHCLQHFECKKRAEALGDITSDTHNLSVAGTHGKTTTTCMLASIMHASNLGFSAFLGGISSHLGSNFYTRQGSNAPISVTEADEFDRSFLKLKPKAAVLTATDADHLDIYGDDNEIEKAFQEFSDLVDNEDDVFKSVHAKIEKGTSYGVEEGDVQAKIEKQSLRGTTFSVQEGGQALWSQLHVSLPGKHNIENALGAALLARSVGVSEDEIRQGLRNFSGIRRRFDVCIERDHLVYIDDYAHHPKEIAAVLSTVKSLFPQRKVTVVFQPHLYTRTRDFLEGFAAALSVANDVVLLPIYPARELPIPGIESDRIEALLTCETKAVVQHKDAVAHLKTKDIDVLLTLGAGDIDLLVEPITKTFG